MKRRFADGRRVSDEKFGLHGWLHGTLQLGTHGNVLVLGIYEDSQGPGHKKPPLGLLYRPVLAAVYSDTISFSGVEKGRGGAWVHQTWYCETYNTAVPPDAKRQPDGSYRTW